MAQRSAFDSGGDWEVVGGRKLLVKNVYIKKLATPLIV